MRRPRSAPVVPALAVVLLAVSPAAAQSPAPALASLALIEQPVEQKEGERSWQKAIEGEALRIGEDLRTGPTGLARLELPWMVLTVSPSSTVRFPDDFLLSAILESGRVVVDSGSRDALRVQTAEASVRGTGRAVVRREGDRTLVSCLDGRFLVAGSGGTVWLDEGKGTVVASGHRPGAPVSTPDPPAQKSLRPGLDSVYVTPGNPLELSWSGEAPAFQVEILPVGSDQVLIQRDVGPPPAEVSIPWGGAFRWRIASRDDRGLEGRPSGEGQIAVELAE